MIIYIHNHSVLALHIFEIVNASKDTKGLKRLHPAFHGKHALGAQFAQVLRLDLFDGLRPPLMGLILGLAGSAGPTQLLRSMRYGVSCSMSRSMAPQLWC